MELPDTATRRRALRALGSAGLAALAGCRGERRSPDVEVPAAAMRDEATPLRVTDVPENSEVTVRAEARWQGAAWGSRATFRAGEDGAVDAADQAPVAGTYDEPHGMGWLWSMAKGRHLLADADAETRTTPPADGPYPGGMTVRFRVVVDGEHAASASVVRRLVAGGVEHRRVRTGDLVGEAFLPPGEGPHPGVLVLHGSGGDPHVGYARTLASHGFAALAVDYFGPADGNPDSLRGVPLSYFERARAWLAANGGTPEVGVVGGSRGGELALLLAATFDWVAAVVAYAPSLYVWAGAISGGPSWTRDGEPLSYLVPDTDETAVSEDSRYVYRPAFEAAVRAASAADREAATIPVEEADAPVLLVTGERDRLWPASEFARRAVARLDDAGYDHEYDHLAYDEAGHAVTFPPYVPTTHLTAYRDSALGGTPAGLARAHADHWPEPLAYLEQGVPGTPHPATATG